MLYTTCYASVFLKNRLTAIAGIKNIIMKLNLNNLAPYLPYGLKIRRGDDIFTLSGLDEPSKNQQYSITVKDKTGIGYYSFDHRHGCEILLRPMTDLTTTIFIGEENFMPLDRLLAENNFDTEVMIMEDKLEYIEPLTSLNFANYTDIAKLLSWHFDVFGLIKKGLAVNINDKI